MTPINVLWAIDHVCYDGSLHGGGRLYWNVLPRFDPRRVRVIPCLLRATDTIREVFKDIPVPVRILNKGKFDPTTLWTFLKLIKADNIQVMHLHCYGASTFGRLAGLLAGVPTVIHDYDTEVYFPYPSYLRVADTMLAPTTRHAIAASPMVKRFLMEKRKIDERKISMMFHGSPPNTFAAVSSTGLAEARDRLGIGDGTKIVVTITKLGPQRGNDILLEAAALVLNTLPDAVFVVVYKTTLFHRLPSRRYVEVTRLERDCHLNDLQEQAQRLGIEDKVRFIEWPENINELVSACDLVVAPFLSERFSSVSLLEAMARGKPLIATDLGEQRELITQGVNGYLVPPGDAGALADRISECLAQPAERVAEMGRQARATAREHSADAHARRLERLYVELATDGRLEARKLRTTS